jgi:acyl phosphate:glycerol-3-phosphate acyltransferase
MTTAFFALIAYLIGSLSFAVVVSRTFRLPDPRTYGSGNPGATNVLRTGRKSAAALTLMGDAAKGSAAYLLARHFVPQFEAGEATLAAVALAAFLGHLYPVYFRFKGGKGVATAAGILLAMDWRLGLSVVATWFAMALIFRYSSLAALTAAAASPLLAYYFLGSGPLVLAVLAMAVLLVWRHRGNAARLLRGEEGRITLSKGL